MPAFGERVGSKQGEDMATATLHGPLEKESPVPVRRVAAPPHRDIRFDIQGMRALAVILVILNHTLGFPAGGFIGVDVFFVISGFIITSTMLREYDNTRTISFKGFYIRRIKRILPAALLVLVLTFFVSALVLPLERARSVMEDSTWAAFFGANWRMLATNVDYFSEGLPPSPLQHYWSLSIEEQFYFVWPWIMLGVLVYVRRKYRTKGLGKQWLLWVVGAIIVASFAWSAYETITAPDSAYFSSLTRFWELGLGALAAIALPMFIQKMHAVIGVALTYTGLVMVVAAALMFTEQTPFPGFAALLPVVGSALVMVGGYRGRHAYSRALFPLTNKVSVYLGNISYSLYLWHFPLVVLGLAFLPAGALYYAVVLGGTLGLSILTYHFVENPVRKSSWPEPWAEKREGFTRVLVAGAAAVCIALAFAGSFAIYQRASDELLANAAAHTQARAAQDAAEQGQAEAALTAAQLCAGAGFVDPAHQPCDVSELPLMPNVNRIQSDTRSVGTQDCSRNQGGEPVSCVFGSESSGAKRVAIIGDSHAEMYLPALVNIAEANNWQVTTYIGWGCQWAPAPADQCGPQIDIANADFTDDTPFDMIVAAGSRGISSQWTDDLVPASTDMASAAIAKGTRVVYLDAVPIPSEEALLCLQRPGFDSLTNDCATPEGEALSKNDRLGEAMRDAGATVVSFQDVLCSGGACPTVMGQVIVYRDTAGHLTATFIDTLQPYIEARLLDSLA